MTATGAAEVDPPSDLAVVLHVGQPRRVLPRFKRVPRRGIVSTDLARLQYELGSLR